MRARDVRAIGFCVATTVVLLAGLLVLLHSLAVALGLTVAYAAFLLTRPRMIRVMRRLNGEPDWGGYFDNGGRDPRFREPGRPASPPRQAGRR